MKKISKLMHIVPDIKTDVFYTGVNVVHHKKSIFRRARFFQV